MTKSTATAKPFFLRQENRYLWFALILPAYLLAFAWVEAWIPADACRPTYIPLDDQIPFLEGFIVPYMLWFPMLLAMGLYLARYDHEGFKRYMTYIGVAFFSVIALYLLFPNRQDLRVTQFPRENLFTRLVALVYSQDTNTNVCHAPVDAGLPAFLDQTAEAGHGLPRPGIRLRRLRKIHRGAQPLRPPATSHPNGT